MLLNNPATISDNQGTGTIENDDTDVSVAVSPGSVNEDGITNLVYTFTRSGVTSGALTVNFDVSGTAAFNTDYTPSGAASFNATSGTVTIADGASTATVTVDPTDDTTVEPDETVILTLASGSYNVGTPSAGTGTILNDDNTVTLAVSPGSVSEDGITNLVYTFTRSGVTSGALTVNFDVSGTAAFNTDYTPSGAASFNATSGTVTIADGASTATVTIDPAADTTVEPDETVILTLASGSYNVGTPSAGTGTIVNDDTDVSVAVSPGSVSEDGATNLVYTFTRSGVISGALTVNFDVSGTAAFNTDYTPSGAASFDATSGTVTIADGASTATVTIDPAADTTVEPDETVILTLASGSYNVSTPSAGSGTIVNDDTDVSVAVSPGSVSEDGATNLVYTFTRSGVTSGALTVNFDVSGTAAFSTDYTPSGAASFDATSGTVTIADGASTATVTIDPAADTTVEPDETVILTLASGSYNVGTPSAGTGTILNDDNTVTLAVSPGSVSEDGITNLVYTFTRSGVTSGALTVNFDVSGTAAFSTDYTPSGAASFNATSGTVTIADGASTATVTIDPAADTTVEPDETVILTLASGSYNVGTPSAGTGTIVNDDTDVSVAVSPGSVNEDGATNLVYTFTRSGVTSGALTVNFDVSGTAAFNTDYTQSGAASFNATSGTVTIADGASTATVTVDPTDDTTVEPDETIILTVTDAAAYDVGTPAAATGTITNDDAVTPTVSVAVAPAAVDEDGTAALVYTFTRTGETTAALPVSYAVSGTASSGDDFAALSGTVTIPIGQASATVTVDPTDDTTVEPDETIILTVTDAAAYDVGTPAAATGTIVNDDAVTPTVSVAVAPAAVDEDGTAALVYTFTRTGETTAALPVSYAVSGTATSDDDFAALSGTVTIPIGQASATVTVDPTDDTTVEPDETIILTVTDAAAYDVGTPAAATGTIVNDDTDVSVAVSPGSVNEDGTTNLVYTFTRSGVTSGALTVNFDVSGTAAFNTDYNQSGAASFDATSGTVTIADGASTATVTVDPTDDTTVEPDETIILTVTDAAAYDVGTPAAATGTITNDDVNSVVSLAINDPSISEGDSGSVNLDFTVTRSGDDTLSAITVAYNTSDNTATAGSDYTATSGTVTIPSGAATATISVPVLGDSNIETNEEFFVNLTGITNVTGPAATLAAKTDFTAGTTPFSVAIGDLNGDGRPDLAIANAGSDSVSVLLNTTTPGATTPSYAAKIDFTTGTSPRSVAIGDLNGDGRPDLAIANLSSNSVSVLLNTTAPGATTPSYAAKTDLTTGTSPRSVAIGDLNGDGKPDLAIANFGSASVSVLLNTTTPGATTPSYAAKTDFTTGDAPSSVAIGDLNGDGRPDLAIANLGADSVSVLLNTTTPGATTPSYASKTDFTAGDAPVSVVAGDLNGDGRPDLAIANSFSNSVSVLLNTTTPGATTPSYAAKTDFTTGTNPYSVAIGDLNGDGKPDLAIANRDANSVSLLLNTATPGATVPDYATKTDFATGTVPSSVAIGDLNGDGRPDLAIANRSDGSASVLLNTTVLPAAAVEAGPKIDFTTGTTPVSVAIGDLNGDGKPDMAIANRDSASVSVLLNNDGVGSDHAELRRQDRLHHRGGTLLGGNRRSQRRRPARLGDRQPRLGQRVGAAQHERRRERPRRATPPRPTSPPGMLPARWQSGISTATAGPTWRSLTNARPACRCCSTRQRWARPRRAMPPRPTSTQGHIPCRWRSEISTATDCPTWRSPTSTRTACRCCSTQRRRVRPRRATPPRPTSPLGMHPVRWQSRISTETAGPI